MTINATDVKILKSERLTDFEDGGGKMTGFEVVDGVLNNLFPDISRLDRTYGRVSLRKAFAAIRSHNTDAYYGAHAIITEPPLDDNVSVTMFSTNSYADERSNARDRIESYLTPSIESRFVLFGNHLAGSRILSVYCDPAVPSPEIGDVYALRRLDKITDDDTATELDIQYQRIQRIISRVNGDYIVSLSAPPRKVNVDVLVMEVSSIFHADFPGAAPTDTSGSPAKTKVNQTTATDAARYYGVTKLAVDAVQGAFDLQVENIYASLVPSAQAEVPVIDQPGAGAMLVAIAAAPGAITTQAQGWTGGQDNTSYFIRGIVPGTFTLDGTTFDNGLGTYDNGAGITCRIDYPSGKVVARPTGSVAVVMTATPAAPLSMSGYTSQFVVDAATRSYNYVFSLGPLPAPGSVYVDYKAQGKWYRLRDNGVGQLVGDLSSYGSGVVDYATGSLIVTAGALPDVNTAVLYGWGSRENLEVVTGTGSDVADHSTLKNGAQSLQVNNLTQDGSGNVTFVIGTGTPIVPGSAGFAWLESTGTYSDQYGQVQSRYDSADAYDDGLGALKRRTPSDPAFPAGSINYTTGQVTLKTADAHFINQGFSGPGLVALSSAAIG